MEGQRRKEAAAAEAELEAADGADLLEVERRLGLNGAAEGWGMWPAVAWLRLKGWQRRLRLKGCAARRLSR